MDGRAALLDSAEPLFQHPHIIRYDADCFTIRDKDVFVYSAALHYCRVPKELWRDRILKLKLAGFNTIETYVFWNYHEPVEGQVDMREIEEFIQLVKELGMWLILRIGPYVCAEWDAGGFPHWLIAKQFPLRSDHPESIKSSQYWYDRVLPIVKKNMITVDGPVIMVQIENEYDYWHIPAQQKMNYVTALAHMVWKAGVDVPIITNWVSQARENSNPVMARIMDTADFYPHWNIQKETTQAIATLRKEEPTSPIGIAELQGGWFSQYGGKLSEDQDGVNAAQLNLLTKSVIERGTAFTNLYMGHGGTNFEWAARKVTTTYDYAAPVSEPGGLWDKYYAARAIGSFLDQFGPMLVRSGETEFATSTSTDVSVSLRKNGKSGFLFIRENANDDQQFQITFPDPAAAGKKDFKIPREGKLSIRARGMKMLPVEVAIPGGQLRYSTAEVLASGSQGKLNYLIVYGEPGEPAEIALAAEEKPHLQGAVSYEYFDAETKTAVVGFSIGTSSQMFLWNDKLQIVVLPRRLAERTYTAKLTSTAEEEPIQIPVITDCALMTASKATNDSLTVTLDYAAGEHELCTLMPTEPVECRVDGNPTHFHYDSKLQYASVNVSTPHLPFQPLLLVDGEYRVETFDPSQGDWLKTAPAPLEKLGKLPYGYVKYRAIFEYHKEAKLFLETQTEDSKQVFLNGSHIAELSTPKKLVSCELGEWAKPGQNVLEISYEAFGSENGNKEMSELKGITAIRMGDEGKSRTLDAVAIQRFSLAATSPQEAKRTGAQGTWRKGQVSDSPGAVGLVPAYTWFRTEFPLTSSPDRFTPLKLKIDADRDALIYVNGRFIGYYQTIGPQSEFYLPEPYLHFESSQPNVVMVMLAYTDGLQHLKQLVVSPYSQFATRRTEVEFRWKPGTAVS
ncbi:beta-galactosidase [Silvibacterium acidisoli]|uniref:beta-galactosidase n=1 Tax=Acidobacteriaceae bacterium ZG23-2 TaxID=2883246 RepID=UPI00406CB440